MSVWEHGPDTPAAPQSPARAPWGSRAPSGPFFADYFDGQRAITQRVALSDEYGDRGHSLLLTLPSGEVVRWPLRRIRTFPDQAAAEATTFVLSTGAPDRLVVRDREVRRFIISQAATAHQSYRGPSNWRRAALVFAGGAAALAAIFLLLLPTMATGLARIMNPEAEVAMGDQHFEETKRVFGPFGSSLEECTGVEGRRALDLLTERVAEGVDLPFPLRVAVLDDRERPTLNAYAVAGGRITFFNSMIEEAERPEEIAAVLAHELGHVVHSDPVRGMLESASGLAVASVLIGDFTGGNVLSGTAGAALQSSYSRKAERAADEFAYEQLTAVGLPPSALGRMFERLRDRYGESEGLVAHFASHPQIAARIEAAADAGDPVIGAPALTPKEWQALRDICN